MRIFTKSRSRAQKTVYHLFRLFEINNLQLPALTAVRQYNIPRLKSKVFPRDSFLFYANKKYIAT